jgi:uncharacterized membrane protein YheB (UPF0754 family)
MTKEPIKWYIAKEQSSKRINELSDKYLKSIRSSINKKPEQLYHGFKVDQWNRVIDKELIKRKEAFKIAEKVIAIFSQKTTQSGNLKKTINGYLNDNIKNNNQVAVSRR